MAPGRRRILNIGAGANGKMQIRVHLQRGQNRSGASNL
jgi:hypothetical protein